MRLKGIFIENLWMNHRRLVCVICVMMLMSACATTKVSRLDKVDTVISKARTYIGTPYKYGGTTVLGMDCSGLLMRSFESIDIYIPRTSRQQSRMGKPVITEALKPGDLVFFATKKGSRKVTHTGLVTEVNGMDEIRFIHASSSRGVIESNLMSDYYRKRFKKARRIKF